MSIHYIVTSVARHAGLVPNNRILSLLVLGLWLAGAFLAHRGQRAANGGGRPAGFSTVRSCSAESVPGMIRAT